jgi:hypothetical protein
MPDRNMEILRDLKRQIYARRKGSLLQNFAVLDAATHDPAAGILGTIVYAGTSKAQMLLFESEFLETVPKPRNCVEVAEKGPELISFFLDPEGTGNNIPVEPIRLFSSSLKCIPFHQIDANATIIDHSERKRSPSRQQDPVSEVRLIWRRYKLGIKAPFAEKICRVFQFFHT